MAKDSSMHQTRYRAAKALWDEFRKDFTPYTKQIDTYDMEDLLNQRLVIHPFNYAVAFIADVREWGSPGMLATIPMQAHLSTKDCIYDLIFNLLYKRSVAISSKSPSDLGKGCSIHAGALYNILQNTSPQESPINKVCKEITRARKTAYPPEISFFIFGIGLYKDDIERQDILELGFTKGLHFYSLISGENHEI